MLSKGIVLKILPRRRSVVLLDEKIGKIDFFDRGRLCVGSLIWYSINQKNNGRLDKIELIDLPMNFFKEHILFFHHVFEICYYFAPYCSPVMDVYSHVLRLYSEPGFFETTLHKKLFVGRLLYLLGVCPDDDFFYINLFSKPIDILMEQEINLVYERKLSILLLGCIQTHPNVSSFKTVHFLNENGVP